MDNRGRGEKIPCGIRRTYNGKNTTNNKQKNKYNGKNTTKTSLESDLEKAYLLRVQGNAAPKAARLIAKAVEFIHKTLKGIQIFMFSTVTDQQGS